MMKKFFIFIIFIIVGATVLYFYKQNNTSALQKFLKNIESNKLEIDEYYVYGNHLNIKGSLNGINSSDIKLVLKSEKEEIEYDVNIKDSIFTLSSKINEGINLEKLNDDIYYILLKVNNNDSTKYYSFTNKTNYNNITYYSLIHDNKTNKMNINFENYFNIKIDSTNNIDDVYDIVIDAGHGGDDSGAVNGKHFEANYTYEYATALKKKLSNMGYKVKLTRDVNDGIKTYGKNSRTAIPYEAHAKLLISIHFNSSEDYIRQTGIEVYAPNNANLDLALSLASSIKNNTSLGYSTNTAYLYKNGVYIKTFRESDISYMNNEAKKNNYKPYNITTSTPYLYMIRETGGIITKAYVDGRNKKREANPYYNSNIGVEAYLLELGYINNSKDLNVIINEKNNYVNAIANTINDYIKNNF